MKVIFYISETARTGGGEVSLLTLTGNLSPQYRPVVICYGDGDLHEGLAAIGVPAKRIRRGGTLAMPRVILELIRLIRRYRPAVVHVNTFDIRGGIAARLAGVPLIGHLRVIFPATWVDRTFVRISKQILCVSSAARDAFCGERFSLRRRFRIIPNAVASSSSPANLRDELGLPNDCLLIGAVGRLILVKGLEYLIDAFSRIRRSRSDPHLILAGRPGPDPVEQAYSHGLKRRVEDLGIQDCVHFLGYRQNAAGVIAALDILAVPSVIIRTPEGIWAEGFGRVAIEAMASGVPVVAAHTGGLPEIVCHGLTGLLIPPEDPDALEKAILKLMDDPDLRRKYGLAGKQRYLKLYTVDRHVKRIEEIYGQLSCRELINDGV